jgi:hypothetical protein
VRLAARPDGHSGDMDKKIRIRFILPVALDDVKIGVLAHARLPMVERPRLGVRGGGSGSDVRPWHDGRRERTVRLGGVEATWRCPIRAGGDNDAA